MESSSTEPGEDAPAELAGARHAPAGERPGDLIDRYTLIEEIGQGGMGTVWLARQEQPVQRRVALKIIKLGMDTRQVVARFEAERQALALMDHPSIAKVYDAGATETGRPYFVMEMVEGPPITEFCDSQGLGTEERLALFRQVCLAVQHAHQKGVLHRDLKPSNILVTRVDGAPQPKVIDFGIAKAIEKPLTDSSLATEAFQVMGTPEYMPPEQASGHDVDTRADVYSLGVVLYELLTGTRPFARETGGLEDLSRLLRQIHDVTPPKPSTRASELVEASESVAQWRGARATAHTRRLRGDLDWIVMKALEKDRERRYATALELADDVARHLENEPVLASPPSTTYLMRKFVRRNRLLVGSAAVVGLTLLGATAGLGWLYTRALASEARATREAETSRQALGFMTEMFAVSDPGQARGETVTAREILDRGAERIVRELGDQPAIRATLMATMGSVYDGLGLYDRAEELIAAAAHSQAELLGAEHPDTLRSSSGLAGVLHRQSHYAEAEELLRATIERQLRALGPEHVDTLDSRLVLGQVLERQNEFGEAEALTLEVLATARRALGAEHPLALVALNQLGLLYLVAGRFDESETLYLRGLEALQRILGADHPETLIMTANLAELYVAMGRFEEAEVLYGEALETARRVFGDEHRDFLQYRAKLALLYFHQQLWAKAEENHRAILATQRRTLGDEHIDTLMSLNNLGVCLARQERFEEAEEVYLEALEGLRRRLGEEHEQTLTISGNMAIFYLETGKPEEAEALAWKTYEGSKALHGELHPDTLLRLENLSNIYYKRGDLEGSVGILEQVLEARRELLGNEHPAVTRTLVNLSVVRADLGDPQATAAVREELLERTVDGLGFDYPSVAEEIEKLAGVLYRAAEYERAEDCNREVLRIRLETLGAEDPATLAAMRDRLRVALLLERWPEVEPLASEFYEAHLRGLGADDTRTAQLVRMIVEGFELGGDELQAEAWRQKLAGSGG